MEGARTVDLVGPLSAVASKLAPPMLWTRGDTTLFTRHPRVAVVGTRHPSAEGERRAKRLVRELAKADAVIVSGLAQGIDTVAHTEALARGARTIAVIGTPLDEVFPKQNAALQRRIGDTELLVSEFAPGSPTTKANFPRRNRTMALLADASVIIEAGESSGARSAGWEAIRLGRPLFLLKSLVDARISWATKMLDHGALVLTDPSALLDVLRAASTIPLHAEQPEQARLRL